MMKIESAYQETLDYIYSFVDFSRTHQDQLQAENFNLDRMERFLDLLGSPQNDFPALHIAGSKGKGSVSALCASVYQTAGWKVGLYTSPHLKDFEERMQINFQPISRVQLVQLVDEIKPVIDELEEITTFEIMTGLAFLFFSREEVDIAVIEVGLGGRLDATNLVSPLVSVITSLYLDHTGILGDTLEEIAGEKGGIIKPGIPVVSAPQEPAAARVLKRIADHHQAAFIQVGEDYLFQRLKPDLDGETFQISAAVSDPESLPERFTIPLLGEYQVVNAAVAYAALQEAGRSGFPVSQEQIRRGFQQTVWPARFEVARKSPPVVFDSAHNPAAMDQLMEAVQEFFPGIPLIVVFGISEDKQLEGMYRAILPGTCCLICTQADHPRAMDAHQLLQQAGSFSGSSHAVPDVGEALKLALDLAGDRKMVLVTGSIFVAATARIAWQQHLNSPE